MEKMLKECFLGYFFEKLHHWNGTETCLDEELLYMTKYLKFDLNSHFYIFFCLSKLYLWPPSTPMFNKIFAVMDKMI